MGRFDALTKIEDKQPAPTPSPMVSSNTPINQEQQTTKTQYEIDKRPDNTGLLANQRTSRPVNKQDYLPANQQVSKPTSEQTSVPTEHQASKDVNQQIISPTNIRNSNSHSTLSTKENKIWHLFKRRKCFSHTCTRHTNRTKRP